MPSIKLTYFGIQGPAEPSRLALTIGIPVVVEPNPACVVRPYLLTLLPLPRPCMSSILGAAGIPFEDERIDRETMLKMREDGKLSAPGVAGTQVPQLVVDGKILQQSQAIATYCAKLAGLYPSDPWEAAKVDEAIQFINQDIRARLIEPTMRIDDAEAKAKARSELNDMKLPEKFAIFDALLAPTGYLVGR